MRRVSRVCIGVLGVAALLGASACTTGVQGAASSGATDGSEGEADGQITVRLSSFFSDREAEVIDHALEMFEESHPGIKVEHTSGQTKDTQLQSLRSKDGFDVIMYGESADVPSLCNAGSFVSLNDDMERDEVEPELFVEATMEYTTWDGVHCALPMLSDVYALYYNKKLLSDADVAVPKTLEELSQAAETLTVKSSNGSIERAGFMPLLDYGQMNARSMTPPFDLNWLNEDGTSAMDSDPKWADMLIWQKDLIGFYGGEELQAFRAALGDEFSAQHPFYTEQLAMMVDGEWRVAFLENEMPDMEYGVVPIPSIDPAKSGGGYIAGTTLGIPSNARERDAAWEVIRYLSTDDQVLEYMASELRNVPTTVAGLNNEKLRESEPFAALMDIALNANSRTIPATLSGAGMADLFTQNIGQWQWSSDTDPASFLTGIADQVNALLEQSER